MPYNSATKIALLAIVTAVTFLVSPALATCSSTTTPPGVLTDEVGTIMSDSDGAGASNYDDNENCTWTVKCPSGTTFGIIDIELDLSNPVFGVDTLNISDAASGTVLESYREDGSKLFLETNTNEVVVQFVTSPTANSDGFTLSYACLRAWCSARTSTGIALGGGATTTGRTGQILSEVDGVGIQTLVLPNETCSSFIQCPPTTPKLALRYDTRLYSSSLLGLGVASYQNTKKGWLLVDTSASSNTFPITFTSGGSNTKQTFDYGYTVDYVCNPTTCSSNSTGSTFTADTGAFYTDLDGSGSTIPYAAGEDCVWTIQCPADKRELLMAIRGQASIGTNYTIWTEPSFAVLNQQILTTTASVSLDGGGIATLSVNEVVKVQFNVTADSSRQSNGATFAYGCRATKCGSRLAGVTQTAPWGELTPGLVIDNERNTVDGERCDWPIACPAGYRSGVVVQLVGKSPNDPVVVIDADTDRILINATFGGSGATTTQTAPFHFFSSSNVRVAFNSSANDNQLTIVYQCLAQGNCTSPNVSSVTSDRGVILTDADGTNSGFRTASGQSCSWLATCDNANSKYIVLSDEGGAPGNISATTPNSSHTYFVTTSGIVNENKGPQYIDASSVLIHATSLPGSAALQGSNVTWRCSDRKCPVEDGVTHTAVSGTIQTDRDGTGFSVYSQPGERCEWTITCPAGYDFVTFDNNCRLGTQDDRWNVYDATSNALLGNLCRTNGVSLFPRDALKVMSANLKLIWEVGGATGGTGAVTNYECGKSSCAAARNQTVVSSVSGHIVSDLDGAQDTTTQSKGELCSQQIQCPNNEPFVAMRVRYGLHRSPKELKIGDVVMPEHTSSQIETENVLVRTAGGSVTIVQDSLASTTAASGYEIDYLCRMDPCLTLDVVNQTGFTSTFSSGFGSGDITRSPGLVVENCTWSVTCPASTRFIRTSTDFGIFDFSNNAATYKITSAGTGAVIRSVTGSFQDFETPTQVSTGGVVVNFDFGGTSGSDSGKLKFGVDWSVTCTSCSFQQPAFSDVTGGVFIKGDADGEVTKNKTVPGDRCFRHLHCPNGRVLISKLRGNIGVNTLSAYKATSAMPHTVLDPATMPLLASFSGELDSITFYLGESDVFLQFNASEESDGYSLVAACDDSPACSSIVESNSGPEAGTFSVRYSDASDPGTCSKRIDCPPNKAGVKLDMRFSLKTISIGAIGNIGVSSAHPSFATSQEIAYSAGSQATHSAVVDAPVWVQAYGSPFTVGNGDNTFSLNYTCVELENRPPPPTASALPSSPPAGSGAAGSPSTSAANGTMAPAGNTTPTSSPGSPGATSPPPPPSSLPSICGGIRGSLLGSFKILGSNFAFVFSSQQTREAFADVCRADIARALGVVKGRVCINSLTLGSLLVGYYVTAGTDITTLQQKMMQLDTSGSSGSATNGTDASAAWLNGTAAMYFDQNPQSTETLAVEKGSLSVIVLATPAPAPQQPGTPGGGGGGNNLGGGSAGQEAKGDALSPGAANAVMAVMVFVVLVGASVGAVVVYRIFKRRRKGSPTAASPLGGVHKAKPVY